MLEALVVHHTLWLVWNLSIHYKFVVFFQLAVEYENNALIVKVDTDDEYEFARDMQVTALALKALPVP